jgi:phosphoenolpyruvate carboxykinase (ATP)
MDIPSACPGVPSEILYTRDTWMDKDAYDTQALILAGKFIKNFEKYEAGADPEIRAAAPMI